uniref:Uncharacterized protein n=1 Tax=Babesia bovis TaxID=5865 RepID=S6AYW2_BABBO|nr:hypothetical protein [Babesia bovis]
MTSTMESPPSKIDEMTPYATTASCNSQVAQEIIEGLEREVNKLLIATSMVLYHNYMLKYKGINSNGAKKSGPKENGYAAPIDKCDIKEFKRVLETLRATEVGRTFPVSNQLKVIRYEKQERELDQLKAQLASKITQRDHMRKACLNKARETLGSFNTPIIKSYLQSLETAYHLQEEGERLRKKYHKLKKVLETLKEFYHKCIDRKDVEFE